MLGASYLALASILFAFLFISIPAGNGRSPPAVELHQWLRFKTDAFALAPLYLAVAVPLIFHLFGFSAALLFQNPKLGGPTIAVTETNTNPEAIWVGGIPHLNENNEKHCTGGGRFLCG